MSKVIVNGRALAPVRAIVEGLDTSVEWKEGNQTIWIANRIVNPTAKDFKGQATRTGCTPLLP